MVDTEYNFQPFSKQPLLNDCNWLASDYEDALGFVFVPTESEEGD